LVSSFLMWSNRPWHLKETIFKLLKTLSLFLRKRNNRQQTRTLKNYLLSTSVTGTIVSPWKCISIKTLQRLGSHSKEQSGRDVPLLKLALYRGTQMVGKCCVEIDIKIRWSQVR
jgi:hypothetical protein